MKPREVKNGKRTRPCSRLLRGKKRRGLKGQPSIKKTYLDEQAKVRQGKHSVRTIQRGAMSIRKETPIGGKSAEHSDCGGEGLLPEKKDSEKPRRRQPQFTY